jgi:outer membrane protein assembly factor BamC
MLKRFKILINLIILVILSGCSTIDEVLPDYRKDYNKSQTAPELEIPPDLINSTDIDQELNIPEVGKTSRNTKSNATVVVDEDVLPVSKQAEIKSNGNSRWLELETEPKIVWAKIKQFLQKNNFSLKKDNPNTGIMETEWLEYKANVPESGIRRFFAKALGSSYSTGNRDKFRIRLERGTSITKVFVSHKGMEEVSHANNFIWQNRPSDPELEAEMLNRIKVFITSQ